MKTLIAIPDRETEVKIAMRHGGTIQKPPRSTSETVNWKWHKFWVSRRTR